MDHKAEFELSSERVAELYQVEKKAILKFKGQLDELESALGMLRLGDYFGWRVLYLVHNKRTIRKYEDMLGIKVKEFFPEEGPVADKSLALRIVKKVGNFWKAVSGDIKIEDRRMIGD